MAYNNPYNDGPDEQPSEKEPMDGKESDSKDSGMVTTIPAAMCPGMKAGEEIILHIDKVAGEEYVVSYAPEKGKKEEDSEPPADGESEPSMSGNPGNSMYE